MGDRILKAALPPVDWRERLLWLLGCRRCFEVTGGSLTPLLHDGEVVLTRSAGDLKVGDVVVAQHPYQNKLIIKQVSAWQDQGLVLRGNDDSTDSRHFGALPYAAVLAKVTSILS